MKKQINLGHFYTNYGKRLQIKKTEPEREFTCVRDRVAIKV